MAQLSTPANEAQLKQAIVILLAIITFSRDTGISFLLLHEPARIMSLVFLKECSIVPVKSLSALLFLLQGLLKRPHLFWLFRLGMPRPRWAEHEPEPWQATQKQEKGKEVKGRSSILEDFAASNTRHSSASSARKMGGKQTHRNNTPQVKGIPRKRIPF